MAEDSSFAQFLDEMRAGDQNAIRRIVQQFNHRLIGLARNRLNARIRQKEDPEDPVQSAFASFFRRDREKPFDLTSWNNLWVVLACITLRKCGHRVEYYMALCRNVDREQGQAELSSSDSFQAFEAIARDPSPTEAATFEDTLEHLLRDLDDRERKIIHLALENNSVAEISQQVGCGEYLVRKLIRRIRERWERLAAAP